MILSDFAYALLIENQSNPERDFIMDLFSNSCNYYFPARIGFWRIGSQDIKWLLLSRAGAATTEIKDTSNNKQYIKFTARL